MTAPLTFLFTDLENSTALWQKAPEVMQEALAQHDQILRSTVEDHHGRIVKTTGDGILAVFGSARDALMCAVDGQQQMSTASWPEETGTLKVRMGLHTGESQERDNDFFGPTLNQAARVMGLGYGGQVLLSSVTTSLLSDHSREGVTFTSLGSHLLKGISEPVEIFQLVHQDLAADFPPLKSASVPKHNLPTQLTPLIGREEELDSMTQALRDSSVSLVSIIAPGGMGKTRLALELGSWLVGEFEDGVYFIELAPISQSDRILPALAEALNYQIQPGGRSLKQQIFDYLQNKQMLLILDNFEHIMDGAGIVDEMLRASDGLKSVVTSRQRLGIHGESLFTLSGLGLPEREQSDPGTRYAAIELFEKSASRSRPEFRITPENHANVVRICRLVQGMPLGILLAAQWVSVLSTNEIIEEIQGGLDILEAEGSELPDRQRSIRVVFDYAWNMLNEVEKEIFEKMSVFRGGFTRQAAQNVAGAGLRPLQSLVQKALLSRDPDFGRYVIHELLRQYAAEKLEEAGLSSQAREDHARFYFNYLAAAAADFKSANQLPALKRIEIDFDNIRAAWEHAVGPRDADQVGAAIEGLYLFCRLQSRLEEGYALFSKARQAFSGGPEVVRLALGIRFSGTENQPEILRERLEAALEQAESRGDELETAFCSDALGSLAHYGAQDPPAAIGHYEKACALYSRLDEKFYLAQVLSKLGEAHQLLGQTDLTVKYVNRAYDLQREIGDRMGESETLRALVMTYYQTGDYEPFGPLMEKAYSIQLEANYLVGQASSLMFLGFWRFAEGDQDKGRASILEGLEIAQEVADYSTQAWCWSMLGLIDSSLGNKEDAAYALAQAKSIETDPFRQTGAGDPFLHLNINLGDYFFAVQAGDMDKAKGYLIHPLNLSIMTYSIPYLNIILAIAAPLWIWDGKHVKAAEYLGRALNHQSPLMTMVEHSVLLNGVLEELQEILGPESFEAAWNRGANLDLRVSAEEILQEIQGK